MRLILVSILYSQLAYQTDNSEIVVGTLGGKPLYRRYFEYTGAVKKNEHKSVNLSVINNATTDWRTLHMDLKSFMIYSTVTPSSSTPTAAYYIQSVTNEQSFIERSANGASITLYFKENVTGSTSEANMNMLARIWVNYCKTTD